VLQADDFNESRIRTVVVAVITSNLRLAEAPGYVLCKKKETQLTKDSMVNVSQIYTVDRPSLPNE
jgi:mRNA interferase MazF